MTKLDIASSSSQAQLKQRSFRRFSLRVLFLAIVVIAAVCAFVAWFLLPNLKIVQVMSPVVSPSGDKIAFVVVRDDNRFARKIDVRLSIVSTKTGKTTHTNAEITGIKALTWARDESQIVFVSGRLDPTSPSSDFYHGLESIDLKSGTIKQIAAPEVWTPKYSPNGTYLGYVRHDPLDLYFQKDVLVVQNAHTGKETNIQSGVLADWCWGGSNADIFYVKDEYLVCRYDLRSKSEDVLFAAPQAADLYPANLVSSPDGLQIGYHYDNWFHLVHLQSGKITKHFKCDHYFLDFDWNSTGICYIDAVDGERRNKSKLLVFDPHTGKSSLIATGPFASPQWLGESRILVRTLNAELWAYDVKNGKGEKLFGDSREAK